MDFLCFFNKLENLGIWLVFVFRIFVIMVICFFVKFGDGMISFLIFLVLSVVVVDWIDVVLGMFLLCIVFMYWNVCLVDLCEILNMFNL